MTPEQWKQEFKEQLRGLYEPARRLDALCQLPPKYHNTDYMISETLGSIAADPKIADYSNNLETKLLYNLYHMLSNLPGPRSQSDYLKKRGELYGILEYAMTELLQFCTAIENITEMDDTQARDTLREIVAMCERWKALLEPLQNEIAPIRKQSIGRYNPQTRFLNQHPWNQKAKELLEQIPDYDYCCPDTLHVLSLMVFGLESGDPKMQKQIDNINEYMGMFNIDFYVGDFWNWTPIQLMHYLTGCDGYCGLLTHCETPIEGAIELLCHLQGMMMERGEI